MKKFFSEITQISKNPMFHGLALGIGGTLFGVWMTLSAVSFGDAVRACSWEAAMCGQAQDNGLRIVSDLWKRSYVRSALTWRIWHDTDTVASRVDVDVSSPMISAAPVGGCPKAELEMAFEKAMSEASRIEAAPAAYCKNGRATAVLTFKGGEQVSFVLSRSGLMWAAEESSGWVLPADQN